MLKFLVQTCWKYRDAWGPFWGTYDKFWKRKDIVPILLTDKFDKAWGWRGEVMSLENDIGFSKMIVAAMDIIDNPVLYMLEDHFLQAEPDFQYIDMAVREMEKNPKIGCWRMMPCPGPDVDCAYEGTGIINQFAPYRVSCSAAIWNPKIMKAIAEKTGDPWDFEIRGTGIAAEIDSIFYSVKRERTPWPIQNFLTGISRGKWDKLALAYLKKWEIPVDLSLRPILD